MSVTLDHTIVHASDKEKSARFVTEILGLPPPKPFYHFLVVELANGVSLDFLETGEPFDAQHYAFLISEEEFDAAFARIRERGVTYWPDPGRSRKNAINRNDGGRGLYFEDPGGNLLEIITRPYGSGAE